MSASLQAGTLLRRRYEIIRPLGQGDFGVVYQAWDRHAARTRSQVAIKQMPMQMIVDCERQAHLRATLVHPAIPRILDYFATAAHAYLVVDLVRGSTLEGVLARQAGFLPEATVVAWAIRLCAALDFLHNHPQQTVVFRDLKPNNVMVDRAGRIYLVDFELARAFPPGYFSRRRPELSHLRKGLAIGTAGYSPPEQYRGVVKPQSDLYALGATLHHLLTRRDPRKERPFTFHEAPIRSINPAVSPGLEAIVMKALRRNVKERYRTAREMQLALEGLAGGPASAAARDPEALLNSP